MKIETSRLAVTDRMPSTVDPKQSVTVVVAFDVRVFVGKKELCGVKVFTGAGGQYSSHKRGELIISGYSVSNASTPRALAEYMAAYGALQSEVTDVLLDIDALNEVQR